MARMHAPVRLRWSDIDGYGHVNNSAVLRLLEEARIIAFWGADDGEETDGSEDGLPQPIIDGRPGSGTMTVIASQRLEYLQPTPYFRRALDIQLWISRVGGASIDVSYEVWSPRSGDAHTLYTRALTTLVMVDTATDRPRRLTDTERAACAQYSEPQVQFTRP